MIRESNKTIEILVSDRGMYRLLKKALPHSRDFNRELGSAYFIYRK